MPDLSKRLEAGLGQLGLSLSTKQQQALVRYIDLLCQWNKVHNLTAIHEPQEMLTKHVFDSLVVVPHILGCRVIDIGTGAGIPGLILAIALPDVEFALLDSKQKKLIFVQHVVSSLRLQNVTVIHSRVEDFTADQLYDCIVARAVTTLTDFVGKCSKLLAPGGKMIAMKSKPEIQVPARYVVEQVLKVEVPYLQADRCLIMVKHAM